MNILFYITNYPGYGGIEKITNILSDYLFQQGHNIHILSFTTNCNVSNKLMSLNAKVTFMPDKNIFLSEINKSFLSIFLEENQFDKIIYQDCYSSIHNLLFSIHYPTKEKLIVVEHNSPISQLIGYNNYWNNLCWFSIHDLPRKLLYYKKYNKIKSKSTQRHQLLLDTCHKYVILSDSFKKDMNFLVGNKYDKKIISIPNPVTANSFQENATVKKEKQILFVGRLVKDKGLDYLLQIWKEIEPKYLDWTLSILGEGPLLPYLEENIQKLGLKQIRILGAKPDISIFYQKASILMMTSIFEGWPLVLFEAMNYKCVPIAFDSFASLKDIIDNNLNGFRIPPFDTNIYTKKIEYLLNNPTICSKMGLLAEKKSKQYTIDSIGKLWNTLLED